MTLEELIQESLDRLDSVPDEFVKDSEVIQKTMLNRVTELISTLETKEGNFVYSTKNMDILASIDSYLTDAIFNKDYTKALTSYLKEFEQQANLNNKILSMQFDGFTDKQIYEQTWQQSQRTTLQLFAKDNFAVNIVVPIQNQLQQAVLMGASFGDTVKAVSEFIVGTSEVNGVLSNYIRTNSYDAFAISNATYVNAVNNDMGIEWFEYLGNKIRDTRCFCAERHGKYYHKKEIEAWGRMEDLGDCRSGNGWQGMRKGTNESTIFNFRGGYNCKHAILGRSEFTVPKTVIERNRKKGNIK